MPIKATIEPEGQGIINVLFNPNNYGVDKANTIAEIGVPGLESPILQYVHGNTRMLSMELYFDTFEEQTDVTDYTDQIYDLLEIDPETHVPPKCTVSWGGFSFVGVMDHVSGKFTLFLPDGTPARATLTVAFKEFIPADVLVMESPTQSADHRHVCVVQRGDRLDLIAGRQYGDSTMWRPIADANNLDNPRHLEPGWTLMVPRLPHG
jgi:hypothetical protein